MFYRKFSIGLGLAALAAPSLDAQEPGWRFSVGPAFVSGLTEVRSFYEDVARAETQGNVIIKDSFTLPIGAALSPYYQFQGGARLHIDIGPIAYVALAGSNGVKSRSFFDLPAGVSAAYAFDAGEGTRPYLRAGLRYHLATGDLVDSSSAGAFAAAGFDFHTQGRVAFGFELGMDTSSVKFSTAGPGYQLERSIRPDAFIAQFHVTF